MENFFQGFFLKIFFSCFRKKNTYFSTRTNHNELEDILSSYRDNGVINYFSKDKLKSGETPLDISNIDLSV